MAREKCSGLSGYAGTPVNDCSENVEDHCLNILHAITAY
jgi:hypothetical protein